jgi:hypothetical protein
LPRIMDTRWMICLKSRSPGSGGRREDEHRLWPENDP